MNITAELREKVAAAIWNADNSNPRLDKLDHKIDKALKSEIYRMADAAIQVMTRE